MTVINFKPKQEPQVLVCEKCFATAAVACGCGVAYQQAGKLADKIAKRFPEMSTRDLEAKFGISHMTFSNARKKSGVKDFTPDTVTGRDGKRYRRTRHKAKAQDKARSTVRSAVQSDDPTSTKKMAEQLGVSIETIQRLTRAEQARIDVLDELGIDAKTLSMTAQQKLAVAERQMRKRLEAEFAERWRNEIGAHVKRLKDEVVPTWERDLKAARIKEEYYRKMINNHKPPLAIGEWRTLVMIAHDDPTVSAERKQQAARVLVEKKLQLTGQE